MAEGGVYVSEAESAFKALSQSHRERINALTPAYLSPKEGILAQ